ncbi:hypothetical protein BDZ45DRAFT_457122 [Acephala macrosclerotiorum]|nr:hypothetical protein BDZ45DRAFT_457122 [Acephala macrosclerotiorum]
MLIPNPRPPRSPTTITSLHTMYVPIIYAPPDPATIAENKNIFFIICICMIALCILMTISCYSTTQQHNRRIAEGQDDLHFKTPTYVEERPKWLNDAATSLLSIPRSETAGAQSDRLVKWKEVNERYDGAEDMLRRFCAWQVRKRATTKVVD